MVGQEALKQQLFSVTNLKRSVLCNTHLSPRFDFSYDRITESIDNSIRLLGCKYLDICFCHDIEFAPTLDVITSEALPAMQKAREKGKIKYIGISGTYWPILVSLIAATVYASSV